MRASCHRRRAVVFLDAWIDDEAALAEVARHRRAGIRRRVLDVGPVARSFRANARLASIDVARVAGIADDQSADDEHAVPVEQSTAACRALLVRPAAFRLFFARGPQKRADRRRARSRSRGTRSGIRPARISGASVVAVRGNRRCHPLDDDSRCRRGRLDDGPAERLEPRDVERDVVVDEEDRPRAARARIADVGDHAVDREAMEVAAAHLDDRAEAAVERAAARRLDDVDGPAHHRVAGQHARGARLGRRTSPSFERWCTAAAGCAGNRRGVAKPEPGDCSTALACLRSRGAVRGT